MTNMKTVDRRMAVLGFIRARLRVEEGEPPTLKEIAARLNCSIPTAWSYVAALERANLIKKTRNVARGIRLVEEPPATEELSTE